MTLFEQITSFDNLYDAYKAAARGKHDRLEVLRHDLQAEKILLRLRRQLRDGSYHHGKYRTFMVYDPKVRDVSAAPFTDRIVHHAIVRKIEPLFERIFIFDSYACRKGKGTHAAVLRLQHFLRSAHDKYGEFYLLRADIRKFFASIDHNILLDLLAKEIHDPKTLKLCQHIIASYHEPCAEDAPVSSPLNPSLFGEQLTLSNLLPPKLPLLGQPIGNLTSQLFANIYLNHLDQYVKHTLTEPYYLRYMDDFLIIHPKKDHLNEVKVALEEFANSNLHLVLNQNKSNVHKFIQYERFVGYDAGPFVRRLSKPTVQRFLRRLKKTHLQKGERAARASWSQFDAYASFAHSQGLLRKINPFDKKDSCDSIQTLL